MNIIIEKLPIMETDLVNLIMEIEKEEQITFTMDSLKTRLKQMVNKGYVEKEETIFGNRFKKV